MHYLLVHADHIEDEHESEDEQDVFALEGHQGQGQQQQVTQTLDEAAADPAVSRGGWEGAAATQDNLPVASTSHSSPIDETADSLDSLMEQTFDHLVWRCEAGQLQRTWAVMLSAFERTSQSSCADAFISFLLKRIRDPNRPAITRTACAAYLASFLARAKFLTKPLLVRSLLDMATWCADYCKTQDQRQTMSTPLASNTYDMGVHHQVFYAMCQGLLYAFCYHLDTLLSKNHSEDAASAAQLQHVHISDAVLTPGLHTSPSCMQPAAIRQTLSQLLPCILHHRLSPLTVCAPSVAQQFLQQADRLSLMDCSGLQATVSAAHLQVRPLEMFFPFDPYLLRRSARFLDLSTSYNTWVGTQQPGTDASHVSSDDELEVPEGDDPQSSSSSGDDGASSDSDMQPGSMQAVQHLHNAYSRPLGISGRCKDRVIAMQPESYDSRGMVEGSSLGSSPKLGSFEPIPMSC
ncbi:hypothetical protein ABBQ32_001359 [Trebouxia sp. C0010 RCD-2024]